MERLVEIRMHGRGGQGVVTAARLLAEAAFLEGKFSQAFPEFGPERSGAPIRAYVRISDEPIEVRSLIYDPNVVVIIDRSLAASADVVDGLKDDGLVIANLQSAGGELVRTLTSKPKAKLFYVDARGIASSFGSVKMENTVMLGVFAKATNLVSLESLRTVLKARFKESVLESNLKALNAGYTQVRQA